MKVVKILFLSSILFYQTIGVCAEFVPRTIIAVWDSKVDADIYFTKIHQLAEMPINHLGAKFEYCDIQKGLPDISGRDDVIGVLMWFNKYYVLPKEINYFEWACAVLDANKKFVLMGSVGYENLKNPKIEEFWQKLGLKDADVWLNDTYDVECIKIDRDVVEFERKYLDEKPAYMVFQKSREDLNEHLIVRRGGDSTKDSILVATSPYGGFAFEGYEHFTSGNDDDKKFREWYINPFKFFQLAFGLEEIIACPDTTTLAGRRIYYSHIDGDGFNEYVEIEKYRKRDVIAADVILEEVIKKYSHLPVTVAPIAAEIDTNWAGTEKSLETARNIFNENNVEMAVHSYTHPFEWIFFKNYKTEMEEKFRSKSLLTSFIDIIFAPEKIPSDIKRDERYDKPRPYNKMPFDVKMEVVGAIDKTMTLAPKGKRVEVYQWSGNCLPFEEVIKLTRNSNVRNINGGDTRFDDEYLSYSWVGPIGRMVGKERQIYCSSSNENTYTNLWRDRFWGLHFLTQTWKNTDMPIRVKPINLYYHMYSGSKIASLNAIIQLTEYIQAEEIIPITTSRYSSIADGFYTAKTIKLSENSWKILDRGSLQTIRFDRSTLKSVDFIKSKGVVGQRHLQGSLYVYLDEEVDEPIISIKEIKEVGNEPKSSLPYLINSSWRIWSLNRSGGSVTFWTQGFGTLEMVWQVPENTQYQMVVVDAGGKEHQLTSNADENEIRFSISQSAENPLRVKIQKKL